MTVSLLTRLLAELIGSAVLVTVIGCITGAGYYITDSSGSINRFYAPWSVSSGLLSAMVITGFVSGASFNPAVTVAIIIKNYFEDKLSREVLLENLVYIPIQIIGGFLGALIAWCITDETNYLDVGKHTGDFTAFFAEVFFTFLLALIAERSGKASDDKIIRGVSVVIIVLVGIATVGDISGACFNPAVGIAINGLATRKYSKSRDAIWIYTVGPLVGGILAGLSYKFYKERRIIRYEEEKGITMDTYSQ